MKTVYMDNNATTQVAPEVLDAMLPFFKEQYGNPSSIHSFGGNVKKYIDQAREQAAALINAHPEEIVFTSCGSESDNTAISGALSANYPSKRHVVTSRVEHQAVVGYCRVLKERTCSVTEVGVDNKGAVDMDAYADALSEDTAIASLMWANNETGVIFPIRQLAEKAAEKGVLFHSDAVQAVGKVPVDVKEVPVDMLSVSGHKLHAPKGVGILYVRKGTRISPLLIGGHQEGGKRAGTENVPYIVGIGKACDMAARQIEEENTHVRTLRDKLEQGILDTCPGAVVNGDTENRLPNTTNISFEFVEGESILMALDELGICASSGSACTSGSLEPSHVMRAMGVPFTMAHSSTRFSLSRYNTEEEVDFVLEKLPPIIQRLREISPFT